MCMVTEVSMNPDWEGLRFNSEENPGPSSQRIVALLVQQNVIREATLGRRSKESTLARI